MIPSITVVIPLYNKGKYIERAIRSVLAQTHTPHEIIVIDDGSTDDGPEKVLKFNGKGILLLKQQNSGPGAARNRGLARTNSKYIAFLDADDEWMPTFLETGLSLLDNDKEDITVVSTGYLLHSATGSYVEKSCKLSGIYEISHESNISLARDMLDFMSVCFTIMRTDVVKRWNGFYDHHKCLFGEDRYLLINLLFNERIGIIPKPHGIYHTEASDLCSERLNPIRNVPPYISYPDEMIDGCPVRKQGLMKKLLTMLALKHIEFLVKCGKGRKAKNILDNFRGNTYLSIRQYYKWLFIINLSFLAPAFKWLWLRIKSKLIFLKLINRMKGDRINISIK